MWFAELTGFAEDSASIYARLCYVDGVLVNQLTGQRLICGELSTPSLAQLRAAAAKDLLAGVSAAPADGLQLSECVADVQQLHRDPANAGALFQVASQFNLLEMVSPVVSPENGISDYQYDRTQGPACAIACGAGTIYRNYFVEIAGKPGQTRHRQLDMLADIGQALGNQHASLWRMQNGYALPTTHGLSQVDELLRNCDAQQLDTLRALLRIGLQRHTQVTLPNCSHLVTQAYCSALPVAYCAFDSALWARFARLVLDAAYEATLAAAVVNARQTGHNKVYLTLLGGGAFGNKTEWISSAMLRALALYRAAPLNVQVVSYGCSKPEVRQLIEDFTAGQPGSG
jgi:hypothetical protein